MFLNNLVRETFKKYEDISAIFVQYDSKSLILKYKDVEFESRRVACWLNDVACGKGYVGVILNHTYLFPSLILGILEAERSFFYIDENWNSHSILTVLKQLNVQWILLEGCISNKYAQLNELLSKVGKIKDKLQVHNHDVELWGLSYELSSEERNFSGTDLKIAYVIKTSGTTGDSKIVKVPHSCIVPNILHLREIFNITSSDVILQATPLTFDPSIIEIFLALISGATILFVNPIIKLSPSGLIKSMFNNCFNVTFFQSTPSYFSKFSLSEIQDKLLGCKSTIKTLVLGGEPCPPLHVLRKWMINNKNCSVYNIYGITEVSCWASVHKVVLDYTDHYDGDGNDEELTSDHKPNNFPNDVVPLGLPLSQTLLSVRTEDDTEVIHGEGEMFIGGTERFCLVNEETEDSVRFPLFRATGDIVKVDKFSGHIYYVGRKNRIIKRLGNRVNLSKIEQFAIMQQEVQQCYCVWDGDTGKLALFLKGDVNINKMRRKFIDCLPPSSVPDIILKSQTWPLTSHGKVNEVTLKKMLSENFTSKEEDKLSDIFTDCCCKYLGIDKSDQSSTFLQYGGNSFIALQLVSSLESLSGLNISNYLMPMLLRGSTLKECCDILNKICKETTSENLKGIERLQNSSSSSLLQSQRNNIHLTADNIYKREHSGEIKVSKRKLEEDNDCDNDTVNEPTTSKHSEDTVLKSKTNQILNIETDKLTRSCCRGQVIKYNEYKTCYDTTEIKNSLESAIRLNIEIMWKFDTGKCVDASPVLASYKSGRTIAVVGSHSHMLAVIDVHSGNVISLCHLPDRIESSFCLSPCGKFGFVGCYDGGLYCVRLTSGTIVWKFTTHDMIKSSPTLCLDNSAVVFGSYDHFVYCVNIQDGRLLWSVKLGESGIYCSPCVSTVHGILFIASLDGKCFALRENDGLILWSQQVNSPVFSSPCLIQDDLYVVFAEVSGTVHCLSTLSGTEIWNFKAGGNIFSSLSSFISNYKNEIFLMFGCHDKCVYCLELKCESKHCGLKWKVALDSEVFSTPCTTSFTRSILDINIGSISHSNTSDHVSMCVAISTSGVIYLIDVFCGSVRSQHILSGQVFSSPAVYEKYMCVGCRNNNIYFLNINL